MIAVTNLFNRLNAVSLQFDQLMNRLNEGQGTAGQLLKDKPNDPDQIRRRDRALEKLKPPDPMVPPPRS